ncbi:GAP family protein [Arthrobacter flavus]|uniref:GAP family protein n=1 Tax=Arthrobacter flavus TaxID=95172 RepID=A0ABW4QBK4_9MICC
MGPVIGEVLSSALGIAVSPIPIIAAILMLMTPKAKTTAVGFLLGWLGGISVTATAFTLLSSLLPDTEEDGSQPIRGVIHLVLGVVLFRMAAKQWRNRPKEGEEPPLPKWMHAIDGIESPKAFGMGLLLSAANPKNLVMAASAGLIIGSASLGFGTGTGVIILFTVLAGSTVLVPVAGFLMAPNRFHSRLSRLQIWLVRENSTTMSVLLLVLAVTSIGEGIGNF